MRAIAALKAHTETAWIILAVVAEDTTSAGLVRADLVLRPTDLGRLATELSRVLAVE